jgi:hypothetical protein
MEIHDWEGSTAPGSLIGTFTVYIPALEMYICKVKAFRSKKGGGVFVSLPSYKEEDDMGQERWSHYVKFSPRRTPEFHKACLEALQPFLGIKDSLSIHTR